MKRLKTLVLSLVLVLGAIQPALASYKGTPDNTNDRIVPLMSRVDDLNANGSGFLYSSRIVLTSGIPHLHLVMANESISNHFWQLENLIQISRALVRA